MKINDLALLMYTNESYLPIAKLSIDEFNNFKSVGSHIFNRSIIKISIVEAQFLFSMHDTLQVFSLKILL